MEGAGEAADGAGFDGADGAFVGGTEGDGVGALGVRVGDGATGMLEPPLTPVTPVPNEPFVLLRSIAVAVATAPPPRRPNPSAEAAPTVIHFFLSMGCPSGMSASEGGLCIE